MKHPGSLAGNFLRLAILTLFLYGGSFILSAQGISFVTADLNADGFVDRADLQALAGHLAGSNSLESLGDINGDGIIDSVDQAILQNLVSGYPNILDFAPPECLLYGPPVLLRVAGTPFLSNSVIRIDGIDCLTEFHLNPGDWPYLTTELGWAVLSVEGAHTVVVVNPGLPEQVSPPLELQVVRGYPEITGLTPSEILAGATGVELRVDGSPFNPDSLIVANGEVLPTTYHEDEILGIWLTAVLPDSLTASARILPISVYNPTPWNVESSPVDLTVNNPQPLLTSGEFAYYTDQCSWVGLDLAGEHFLPSPGGTQLHIGSGVYYPNFISSAQLQIDVPVSELSDGKFTVVAENPTPGGGLSNSIEVPIPPPPTPTVDAGPVQTVWEGQSVTLDGSLSTGQIETWRWEQLSGPAVSIQTSTSPVAHFTLARVETDALLVFRLTVASCGLEPFATTSVLVRRTQPSFDLEILSPADGATLHACSITVTGRILGAFNPSDVTVLVDGQPVILAGDTFTAAGIKLLDGRNRLEVTAVELSTFKQVRADITVLYEPPEEEPPVSDNCGWITGTVYDASNRQPLAGARLTVEGIDARLYTDPTGKILFPIADLTEDEPVRSVILNITAVGFLDAQREVKVKRGRYPRVEDVFLVPADSLVSTITPAGGVAESSNGRILLDFPAGAVDEPLQVTVTEIPFGDALPNPMPTPSVWTFAFDVNGDTTEVLSQPVRVHVQNFLGFAPGTPIPVGWYNRRAHRWEHDSMSVVTPDGQFMEFYITHFSVRDPNATLPPKNPGASGAGRGPKDGCDKTDGGMSEIGIDTGNLRINYQTVPYKVMGRDLSLNFEYNTGAVADHIVFTVKVDNTNVNRPDFTTVYLDIDDRHYRATFTSNQALNYYKIRVPLTDGAGQTLAPGVHPYECAVENGYRTYNYWSSSCFACEPLLDTGIPMREPYRQQVRFSGNFLLEQPNLRQSPFGAGWSLKLDSLKQLRFSADGLSVFVWDGREPAVELQSGMIEKLSPTVTEIRSPACSVQPDDTQANNWLDPISMFYHNGELYYHFLQNSPTYCSQIRKVDLNGRIQIIAGDGDTDVNWSLVEVIPAHRVRNLRMSLSDWNNYMVHDASGNIYFIPSSATKRLFKLDREGVVRLVAVFPLDIWELCTDHMGNVYTRSWDDTRKSNVFYKAVANGGVVKVAELKLGLDSAYEMRVDRNLNIIAVVIRSTGNEIWRISPDGIATPLAGHDATGTSEEEMFETGTAAAQTVIGGVLQIFPDAEGNLCYLEHYSVPSLGIHGDRLRKIDANDQVWTLADFRTDSNLPPGGDDAVMEAFNVNQSGVWYFFFDDATESPYFLGASGALYKMKRQSYAFDSEHRYRYDRQLNQLFDRTEQATWEFDSAGCPLACTDQNGNRSEYSWDTQGRLTSLTDPKGGVITLRYSTTGKLEEVEDAIGRITQFEVNAAGDLVRITQPDLSYLQFGYDNDHRLTAKTMADGSLFQYEYDPDYGTLARAYAPTGEMRQYFPAINQGQAVDPAQWTEDNPLPADAANMSTTIDGEGHARYLWTDENGDVLAREDALGNITVQQPDGRGLVKIVQHPDDSWDENTYDQNGNLIRTIRQPLGLTRRYFYNTITNQLTATEDELGHRTNFEYDEQLNLISKTNPLGQVTQYTYNSQGLLTAVIDPLDHATTYEYDTLGNLWKVIDPLGHATITVRDEVGNVTAITDPNGNTSTFTYDDMNRKLTQADPYGNTTTFTYTCAGTNSSSCSCCSGENAKVASITDPLGNVSSFEYDGVGNRIRLIDPLGHSRRMTYDFNRNLLSVCDELGRYLYFEYDDTNQQIAITTFGGGRTQYIYNSVGQVTSRIDTLDRITSFEYDDIGRLCTQSNTVGSQWEYAYDATGNIISLTDTDGHTTRFEHDQLGRIQSEIDPLNRCHSKIYDAGGRVISTTDANGNTTTYTYDDAGRLISKNYPDSTQDIYYYDANSNLLQAINPSVGMSYTYDARNLQLTITNQTINKTVGYTYDENGHKTSLTYPDGEIITYTRDPRGQVSHLESNILGSEGQPVPAVNYTYSADGSLAAMVFSSGLNRSNIYDLQTGRLMNIFFTRSDGSPISDFQYTHDLEGKILTKTSDFGMTTYEYDPLNRLISASYTWKSPETFTYDPTGNRISDSTHDTWIYDAADQLLSYGNGSNPLFSFGYDANGSLISSNHISSGHISQYYYGYEGHLSEVNEEGSLSAAYRYDPISWRVKKDTFSNGTLQHSTWYFYGTEGLLAEYDDSGVQRTKYIWQPDLAWGAYPLCLRDASSEIFYYINDHSTPQKIVSEDLSPVWQGDYSVGGDVNIEIGEIVNNLRYPGQYYDSETNLHYNWNRYYDNEIMRYQSVDPVGSSYQYAADNPISLVDTDGLQESFLACGRNDLSRAEYDELTRRCGIAQSSNRSDLLDSGCVGICMAAQGQNSAHEQFPELFGDTKCYLQLSQARGRVCRCSRCKVIFSKMGRYRGGRVPTPGIDGSIPSNSVGPNPDGTFNYVTIGQIFGQEWFIWANNGVRYGPMTVTLNPGPCVDHHYPDVMWCATCKNGRR